MKLLILSIFLVLNLISCITNRVYFVEKPDLNAVNSKKITQDFFFSGNWSGKRNRCERSLWF